MLICCVCPISCLYFTDTNLSNGSKGGLIESLCKTGSAVINRNYIDVLTIFPPKWTINTHSKNTNKVEKVKKSKKKREKNLIIL